MGEPFYDGMAAAALDAANIIEHALAEHSGPYAIWGHSMGSLIAFEVSKRMQELQKNSPIRLFVSGRKAPHLERLNDIIHHLPDDEFIHAVMAYDGTPKEVFEHEELAAMFLPILRADFRIVENYRFDLGRGPINIPVDVLYGEDDMPEEDAAAWSAVTSASCGVHRFAGGHFFINQQMREIAARIREAFMTDIRVMSGGE
ncbi:Linear gramicidin dehydrogenase LgrE [compost metagenome]